MFENFILNVRRMGVNLLRYSWVVGLLGVFIWWINWDGNPTLAGILLGLIFYAFAAFVGFVIIYLADLFLTKPEED